MTTDLKEGILSIKGTFGKAIDRHRNDLEQMWLDRLRTAWGSIAELRISIIQKPDEANILDLALKVLTGRGEIDRGDLGSFIQRVRSRYYSISDVFTEFYCLEDALNEFLSRYGIRKQTDASLLIDRFKESFCYLFGAVLRETSEFYEHVIEQGNTGFCQTDEKGRIVYANEEMERIVTGRDLIGKPLKSLFEGYESELVEKVLSADKKLPMTQQLSIRSPAGSFVPVGVELAKVFIGDKPVGGYAHITDISKPIELQNEVFDNLMLGIIRSNADRRITFMNKSLLQMLDISNDDWKNRPIDWLVPDAENKQIIDRQLEERFVEGKSDEYEIRLLRNDRKTSIPVKITAAPERDITGKVIRTIGVVRSMVQARIHEHIEREQESQKLLQAVMQEVLVVVPFHRVYVALFSQDAKHVRNFFYYSIDGTPVMERRWWETTPVALKWAKQKEIKPVPNIQKFYNQPDFVEFKEDPAIQEIIASFSSFIYYPVFREGKLIACVVFYSKDPERYSNKDQKVLKTLPLDSAVLMAIHYEEKKNLEFLLNLSKEISRAGQDMQQIARILVDSIATHYDWENVAIFNTRRMHGHFHLLSQHTTKEFRIPEDFTQPIDKGILGYVYKTKKCVNIDNVEKEEFRDIYESTMKKTRSELCIPIESGELFWLLNIEDPRENAFSIDEELALIRLIEEVRVFLERSWLRTFLDKSLLSTSDAVWVADNQGIIYRTNPAARSLLNAREEDLVGCNLAEILRDPSLAEGLIKAERVPNVKIGLRSRDDRFVNVLLSKFRLQEYFKTNVYIAKDLSAQERLEELEYLGKMYYEIATQTQTPLTLIFGWLERLSRQTSDDNVKEVLDRTIRQLRKIELTYNRLSLYDKRRISEPAFPYNEVLCDIREIWNIVAEDLPQNELERIETNMRGDDQLLYGDLFQLSFCFETILSYLIRFLPENEKIHVHVATKQNTLETSISGTFPGLEPESDTYECRGKIAKTLVEMALGEEILVNFIEKHKGTFSGAKWTGDRIEFLITIPLAGEHAK